MRAEQRKPRPKVIPSDPEWEKAKSSCRNIGHDEGVQESFYLTQQYRAMWRNRIMASPVDLNQILRTLTEKKIPFVLTGAHGISGWTGRPRSTQDVDILVKGGRNYSRAVNAIKKLYPALEARPFFGVMGFFLPGEKESLIDVTYPHRADIAETLANPVWVEDKVQGLRYRIPSLEAALANKYGAMVTPTRNLQKRAMDIVDFGWMVTHSLDEGQQPIDLEKLKILGEKACPEGGGEEILRLVEKVKAGVPINIAAL